MTVERQAYILIQQGYRCISNRYLTVARIDREDWREFMARKHAPWSFAEGMDWVNGMRGAGDHYRRCYSKDKIEVSSEVYHLIRKAGLGGGWGNLDEFCPRAVPHRRGLIL